MGFSPLLAVLLNGCKKTDEDRAISDSTPKPIENETIYISNEQTINELYSSLEPKWFSGCSDPAQVGVETKAGTFVFEKNEADRLYQVLEGWDKKDNVGGVRDGKIFGAFLIGEFSKQVEQRAYLKYGLPLNFSTFIPNKTWQDNFDFLQRMQQMDQLKGVHDYPNYAGSDKVWIAATIAALSGLDADILNMANEMCGPDTFCKMVFCIRDVYIPLRNRKKVTDAEASLNIYLNLSWKTDANHLRHDITHEFGHMIFKRIATEREKASYMHLLLDWAHAQDKYAQASREYKTLFENGTDEEQFQLRYNMEEAADAPYLNYIFPGENATEKERWMELKGDRINLPQEDFNQAAQQAYSTPLNIALYHAVALQRGKDQGIDEKLLETFRKKTEALLTTLGGSALKDFQTALKMAEVSSAYAKSPEFQAYVDKFLPEKVRNLGH